MKEEEISGIERAGRLGERPPATEAVEDEPRCVVDTYGKGEESVRFTSPDGQEGCEPKEAAKAIDKLIERLGRTSESLKSDAAEATGKKVAAALRENGHDKPESEQDDVPELRADPDMKRAPGQTRSLMSAQANEVSLTPKLVELGVSEEQIKQVKDADLKTDGSSINIDVELLAQTKGADPMAPGVYDPGLGTFEIPEDGLEVHDEGIGTFEIPEGGLEVHDEGIDISSQGQLGTVAPGMTLFEMLGHGGNIQIQQGGETPLTESLLKGATVVNPSDNLHLPDAISTPASGLEV